MISYIIYVGRNYDQDIVEKAIYRAFEPLIKFGEAINKFFWVRLVLYGDKR